MVLNAPHRLKSELVGELDLLDGLVVDLLLGLPLTVGMRLGPRFDLGLKFVEQIQLHGVSLNDAVTPPWGKRPEPPHRR